MTPEAKVRKTVVKWAKVNGIEHFRNHMGKGVSNGRPDDEFIGYGGKIAWIEFKAPGKKPTKLQEHKLKMLQDRGHAATGTDDSQIAIAFLRKHLLWTAWI